MASTKMIFAAKKIRFWSPAERRARTMIIARSSKTISQMIVSDSRIISFRFSINEVIAIAVLEI